MGIDLDAGNLRQAWASIGSSVRLTLEAVDLWLVDAGFLRPVRTARGEHTSRPLVMVQLHCQADGSPIEGWGECAALADATYDAEDAATAFTTLERSLVPALLAADTVEGAETVEGADGAAGGAGVDRTGSGGAAPRLPRPSELGSVRRAAPGAPLAFAALEMAVADAHLRAEGRSLAGLLGVEGRPVPIGAVVGQFAAAGALVAEAQRLAEQGITRIKMKIGPGWDIEPLDAVARQLPAVRLQADANGAYTAADIGHLTGLDRLGLLCLEQPFGRNDLASHRDLATRITTPICLDESIDSAESAREALAMGACSVICIKPSRLGGLGAALDLVQSCTDAAVPLWMGGMFESGFARGVERHPVRAPGLLLARGPEPSPVVPRGRPGPESRAGPLGPRRCPLRPPTVGPRARECTGSGDPRPAMPAASDGRAHRPVTGR